MSGYYLSEAKPYDACRTILREHGAEVSALSPVERLRPQQEENLKALVEQFGIAVLKKVGTDLSDSEFRKRFPYEAALFAQQYQIIYRLLQEAAAAKRATAGGAAASSDDVAAASSAGARC